jgi:hypothetical protein
MGPNEKGGELMAPLYTHGRWVVKDGHEDDFIRLWHELADWKSGSVAENSWRLQLQDEQDPRRFSSFGGPWESLEAIDNRRAADGFGERIGKIREVVESFETLRMHEVGRIGTIG